MPIIDVPAAVDKTVTTNIAFQEDDLVNQMLVAEQPIDAQRSIDESSLLMNDADGEHVDLAEDENELSEEPYLSQKQKRQMKMKMKLNMKMLNLVILIAITINLFI